MQSAIRPMLVSAAIRLNPQSAMRKTQHRLRRSSLELRGPRNGLKLASEAPEGCVLHRFSRRIRIRPRKRASRGSE
eukprot:5888063-Alexandrium_andersonii.AAC.1